jgi:hypothetical protein
MRVFYRLGTAGEKTVFESHPTTYEGIAVGANLAAFYPDWLPTFLKTVRKPFFVDPVTYVFARSLENIKKDSDVKKSFYKLAKAYSDKLTNLIGKEGRQLIPKDFWTDKQYNAKFIEDLAKNVIDFQMRVMQAPSQLSLLDYAEILGEKITEEVEGPEFLVAPYFYSPSLHDPWYQISLEVARKAISFKGSLPLFAVLCTSRELLLDKVAVGQIAKDYSGFDGYILWISEFDEKQEGEEYLSGLIDLVQELAKTKKPVYTLYGEYFSTMISKCGLSGYCRGICYSASKNVDAATGGARLPQRYYIELNHGKLSETVARTFFTDNPNELCKCEVCAAVTKGIRGADPAKRIATFFDRMDFTNTRAHFLVVHAKEREELDHTQLKDVVQQLRANVEKCHNLKAQFYNISDEHLHRWQAVLAKRI